MKNKTFTTLFFTVLFMSAISLKVAAQEDGGVVYFMQLPVEGKRSFPKLIKDISSVFIDSVFICRLHEDKYFYVKVPVGKHVFKVQLGGEKLQRNALGGVIDIESGKTYYIQSYSRSYTHLGKTVITAHCKRLAEELAELILQDLRIDESCMKQAAQRLY